MAEDGPSGGEMGHHESLDPTPGELEELGAAALDFAREWVSGVRLGPVHSQVDADELHARIAEPLPMDPLSDRELFSQFLERVAPYGRRNDHPRMFGYVTSAGTFTGAVAGFLATLLNQNVTSWRSAPGATTLELLVVEWLKQIVGLPTHEGGLLLSGGSMANFAALLTAVHDRTGVDLQERGVRSLRKEPVIYASTMAHASIPKAAVMMGLGRQAVRAVPTGPDRTLDVARMATAVEEDLRAGRQPVAVVANAGDVNVGAVDPMARIAELCRDRGLWFHVDAAYGGFASGVPAVGHLFDGMSEADSLTLDPHKWLFAPLDAGCLLVRELEPLHRTFSQGASYLDVLGSASDFAFWNLGPELSRRFRALPIWMTIKRHGFRAITEAIERNIRLAGALRGMVEAADDFELVAPGPLSIVCFRYVPPGFRDRLASGDPEARSRTAEDTSRLNRAIAVELQTGAHESYLSNVTIDGQFALRVCLVNHRTTKGDLEILLQGIRRLAAEIHSGGTAPRD